MEVITLGAGCFWCLEGALNTLRGIESAISGYMGGRTDNPTYKEVCSGTTGHAEVVQVTFDPEVISLQTILDVFWTIHDPTQLNRQGNDVGTQYRSCIFYRDADQLPTIEDSIKNTAKQLWGEGIVTTIESEETFYPAEGYHQGYYNANPNQGYCMVVVGPKINKVRSKFKHLLKNSN